MSAPRVFPSPPLSCSSLPSSPLLFPPLSSSLLPSSLPSPPRPSPSHLVNVQVEALDKAVRGEREVQRGELDARRRRRRLARVGRGGVVKERARAFCWRGREGGREGLGTERYRRVSRARAWVGARTRARRTTTTTTTATTSRERRRKRRRKRITRRGEARKGSARSTLAAALDLLLALLQQALELIVVEVPLFPLLDAAVRGGGGKKRNEPSI